MRHRGRGQAMMEFAVVATLLATLLAGVLEFGRVWSAALVLNAAVRDGARLASVTDKNNNRVTTVKSRVQSTAASYFATNKLNIQVQTATVSGQPLVTVTATGSLAMLFSGWPGLGKNIDISRSVSMRDETVAGS